MDKFQWNFNQNANFFIHENASENIVWEVAAILSGGDELSSSPMFLSEHTWGPFY